MNTFTRKAPSERKAEILQAALHCAAKHGFTTFTREHVANAAGVSPASVNVYFHTMANLRRDVMRAAVRDRVLGVVAQGLVMRDRHALKAPADLRAEALGSIK